MEGEYLLPMLKTKLSENSIRQNIPLNIGFFYYFKSTSITTYYYHLTVKLDASGNGTLDHI